MPQGKVAVLLCDRLLQWKMDCPGEGLEKWDAARQKNAIMLRWCKRRAFKTGLSWLKRLTGRVARVSSQIALQETVGLDLHILPCCCNTWRSITAAQLALRDPVKNLQVKVWNLTKSQNWRKQLPEHVLFARWHGEARYLVGCLAVWCIWCDWLHKLHHQYSGRLNVEFYALEECGDTKALSFTLSQGSGQ